MTTNIESLAAFTADTRFDTLPAKVVEETKRVLMDSLGCALGGLDHPKGIIGVQYARLQGPGMPGAQASIIGTGERISAMAAAFANSELINALDFDAILPPGHVSPYVIPGALAAAEAARASGKDLLCAVAVAHEMSNRIGKGLDYLRDIKDGKISPPPVHGYASTVFGATAALGKVKGHSSEMLADAISIAASMSPVNAQWSWSLHVPTATIKYAVAGALVQAAMTGASLAELGHTGDRKLLDDAECGWPRMSGSSRWSPESVMPGLGTEWIFPAEQTYKPYPHCRAQHAPIQVVREIVSANGIKPSEIEGIKAWVEGFVMQPLWLNRKIEHVTQGQFSIAHGLSVAAHLLPPGKSWQSPEVVFDPSVLALMEKVECEVHPDYEKLLTANAASRPTRIEVRARGKTFVGEKRWAKGTPSPDSDTFMTNEELLEKFARNAEGVLSARNIDLAAKTIWDLESTRDVGELMKLLRS
ncbi:MmgE/PrpD family protein [Variovorax sp. WS11]|uniref:MmgE/PrpD family protein n=1 Tax=Variovorax sp. WS11 TaxID=1105204 RepID=UPI000D0D2A0D|nr:MmgE/PrpD family protein [Variovorax sp. WS11]NDZ18831.1 MmgE/PrpD family protein [Variovorax sp. WS11]PSL79102.1 MmgE/PrpD family protein [Variovorax sp. WS11]